MWPALQHGLTGPHNRKRIGKDRFNMKSVSKIPLDNPLYRLCRKLVFAIDNLLFNFKGSAGPKYQSTRFALVLPFLFAIAAASYNFFGSLFFGVTDKEFEKAVSIGIPILLVANLILTCRNIFIFRSWVKKIFYPVFIAAVTMFFFFLFLFICVWVYAIVMIILILWLAFCGWVGAGSSSGGGSSGGSSEPVYEEAYVDDGSFWGKKLTRTGGVGDWKDGMGHSYEESFGQFHQKD